MRVLSWFCQLVVAVILGQTLFFKLRGAPESVFIFQTLGVEPWGRLATAAFEAVAVVLLLHPRTPALGALLTAGLMSGAVIAHLTRLGIAVGGDGGLLFGLALTALAGALVVLVIRRSEIPGIGSRFPTGTPTR